MKDQTFELIKGALNEIKQDISIIKQDNAEIKETMIVNTGSLNEHMRRTEALEKHVNILEVSIDGVKVFTKRYDVFITVLKTIPFIIVFAFVGTFLIWANINDESKKVILKYLSIMI